MLKILLVSAGRSLSRNKVHTLINLLSLTTGLTVFALLFLYVKHELTWDRNWPDADNIYRLVIDQENPGTGVFGSYDSTSHTVLEKLREFFPGAISKGARAKSFYVTFEVNGVRTGRNFTIVDSEFIEIFELDVIAGDLDYVMRSPGLMAVSEEIAEEVAGDSPLGTRILFTNQDGKEHELEIGAVYRLPDHISIGWQFPFLALMHESISPLASSQFMTQPNQWMDNSRIWMTFTPGTDMQLLSRQLPDFVDQEVPVYRNQLTGDQKVSDYIQYMFQPLTDIYLNPTTGLNNQGGQRARIFTFAAIGFLVLIVGCSNSVSLSLAGILERRREIGIRKALGAQKSDIILQYLGEAFLLSLLTLIPTVFLIELLQPALQSLLAIRELNEPGLIEYSIIVLITIIVGFLSASYPAFILSAVKPDAVLKVNNRTGIKGTMTLRNILVGCQFTFALILLIATLGLYLQLIVTRSQPLGFNPENLAIVSLRPEQRGLNTPALREEIKRIPGVTGADSITAIPNQNLSTFNTGSVVRAEEQQNVVGAESTGASYDFFELLEIPVLAGRTFDPVFDTYISSLEEAQAQSREEGYINRVVLNKKATEALGFESPQRAVGEVIYRRFENQQTREVNHIPMEVIGVVEDNMYLSLRQRPGAEIYGRSYDYYSQTVMIRFEENVSTFLQERVTQVWEQVLGSAPMNFTYVEERLAQEYIQAESESRILLIAAGLAVFLSCIGLYGLAAFTMERHTKEVGVRKVLGASVGSVTGLFLWRFSRPLLIANVVAWPAAVYFILQWIERFPYQMDKAWLLPLCLGGTVLVMVIALVTVGSLTVKAASANPVESLRYE